jgi:hypothetical protein
MVARKSHFPNWIRVAAVLIGVVTPTVFVLRGAWSLGTHVVAEQSVDIEQVKNQEIRSAARFLSDEVFEEIEMIKVRAVASMGQGSLDVSKLNDSSLVAVAETGRGLYLPTFLSEEIKSSIKNISESDIKNSGVSLFPVAIKTVKGRDTLGVAFQRGVQRFVAIVDPIEAFQGVGAWSNGREGEQLQGFLIDNQGKVLIHSEKALSGSSFSNEPIFQQAINPVFRGERVGGIGVFSGARASYMRLRTLPYVVVAERVVHGSLMATASARLISVLKKFKTSLFSMLAVSLLASFGSVILIFTAFGPGLNTSPVLKTTKRNELALEYLKAEQLKRAEEEFAEKTKEIEFLRSSLKESPPATTPRKPS